MIRLFKVFADYHTIYIGDSVGFSKSIEEYYESDLDFLLRLDTLGDDLLRIYSVTDRIVQICLSICSQEPELSTENWDLISEASLLCPSRMLSIRGGTDLVSEAPHIPIIEAEIRLRVYYGNMTTGLRDDFYFIEIWPAKYKQPQLLFRSENYMVLE